jgi:hypothetical protein
MRPFISLPGVAGQAARRQLTNIERICEQYDFVLTYILSSHHGSSSLFAGNIADKVVTISTDNTTKPSTLMAVTAETYASPESSF